MLKTFNITEKYQEIIPYLEKQKNQSSYLCELIRSDMLDQHLVTSIENLSENIQELVRKEIKEGIENEIREAVKREIRSEIREFKATFFEFLNKQQKNMDKDKDKNMNETIGENNFIYEEMTLEEQEFIMY